MSTVNDRLKVKYVDKNVGARLLKSFFETFFNLLKIVSNVLTNIPGVHCNDFCAFKNDVHAWLKKCLHKN